MSGVVLDANVLASAAVGRPRSAPRLLLTAAVAGRLEVTLCERILGELDRALSNPYFADRLTAVDRFVLGDVLRRTTHMHPDPDAATPILRDHKDDYLVALAVAAGVDAIVTGDRDLLDHPGLQPAAISPRAACERFGLA